MFDSIGNMPLHPLVIHAAVIGIPLAVLLAVLFAVPRTRNWARWPLAVVSVGALGATFVSKESGVELQRALPFAAGTPVATLIERHSQLAEQLLIMMVVFAVLAVATAVVVSRGDKSDMSVPHRALNVGLPVLLLVAGLLVSLWVYRVGDIGSRAVWNPEGIQNYSNSGR